MASSYFDSLRAASFRGVPFEVESADESGGRRLAKHEYPLRDTPYAEDLGRKAGEWSVEAFIVQGRKYDYAEARDKLRKALNDRGPGTLIHPSLGELTVSVDSYRLKESTREGGVAAFAVAFVESGHPESPTSKADTAYGTRQAGRGARRAGAAAFAGRYLPLPQELTACSAALAEGAALGMAYLGLPLTMAAEGLAWADSLVGAPLSLAPALYGIYGQLLGGHSYDDALEYGYAGPQVAPYTGIDQYRDVSALERLTARNAVVDTDAVTALRRQIAASVVLEDALATAARDYATADDALATRDTVLDGLDVMAPYMADPVYASVADVRLAVARDLTTRGGQLPSVRRVVLPATIPSVVAAYTVYGDAGRDAEIVSRNRIRHPGQVPGGTPLEVLSR